MSIRWLAVLTVAAQLSVAPAAAQSGGTIELGGFGAYTFYDSSLSFDDNVGAGGWLAFFPLSRLSLEGEASYATTDWSGFRVSHVPIRARLVYSQPLSGSIAFRLGAGYVHNEYGKQVEGADNGATGLLGFHAAAGRIAVRVSGTADYMPVPANAAPDNWNIGVQAGLSFQLGPIFGRERERPQDSDRDGVADQFDACPGTPRGERVDSRGCPVPADADGDGVMDSDDACPDTPAGVAVDARGCPVVEDSDGDGVADSDDACPDTPAGVAVDARGCPLLLDSDGDGVADAEDVCPGSPEGERVDDRGCLLLFEVGATRVILEGVTFESGSSELTAEAQRVLDRVAASLIANPTLIVEVAGHTDNTGYRAYNQILSLGRASAVRRYLVSQGVSGERLLAKGYGPDEPVASNATPEGQAQNRRIELRRLN